MVLVRVGLVLIACLAWAAPADAQIKSFTVNIDRGPGDPDTPLAPGAQETVTATLTNKSDRQQLGSSNITVPQDYTLRAARTPRGTADLNDSTAEFRSLSLRPGRSLTVELDVVAPCVAGQHAWAVTAKQANDYQGLPGNEIALDEAGSDRLTSVGANCAAETDCAEDVECSVSVQKANTRFDLIAFSDLLPDATFLAAAFDSGPRPVCDGYTPASAHWVFFDGPNRAKTGDWSVPATAPAAAADLEFCFAAPYLFVGETADGDGVPVIPEQDANGDYVALLLDCRVAEELLTVLPPCVESRFSQDGRSVIRMRFPDRPEDPRGTG